MYVCIYICIQNLPPLHLTHKIEIHFGSGFLSVVASKSCQF